MADDGPELAEKPIVNLVAPSMELGIVKQVFNVVSVWRAGTERHSRAGGNPGALG